MSEIVDKFLKLINNNASKFANSDIDITPLQQQIMICSPIDPIKFSDSQTAFSNMPGTIIANFCKYSDGRKYSMDVLNIIKRIITKDSDIEDTKIQLMLMVHITKIKIPIHKLARFYGSFEEMTMVSEMTDRLNIWKDLAMKVLEHTQLHDDPLQVNETINALMKEYFGVSFSQRIAETEKIPVAVKFVTTQALDLRGFAGINCIYINEKHFKLRMLQLSDKFSDVQKKTAVLIDIATVALHEYSHVRIRQVLDDMNMSTPSSIIATVSAADPEFGRIAERIFFKVAIDWPESLYKEAVALPFVENFLSSINNNSALPELLYNSELTERDGQIVMDGSGADLQYLEMLDLC